MTQAEERSKGAGLTIAEHTFQDATYVRKIELKVKSKDVQNPNEKMQIRIFADCMQHKAGRVTTSVSRVLQYENDELTWQGKRFECLNYHEVLKEVKKMWRTTDELVE